MQELDKIRSHTQSAKEYIAPFEAFKRVYNRYKLKQGVVDELKKFVHDYVVVAFSASWCPDSMAGIPVFARLETELGLEVRVFGGMETAPFDRKHTWKIPPSPPEAEEWGVTALPWIVVFDKKSGREIGKIIERPRFGMTMEEDLLELIKTSQTQ